MKAIQLMSRPPGRELKVNLQEPKVYKSYLRRNARDGVITLEQRVNPTFHSKKLHSEGDK